MTTPPLVTIGAINYNNGLYVIETLESIKAQTYQNVELIIVDDCSTDNSVTLIADWLVKYNKPVKFIQHPKNLGVCATCNDVLKNATGQYISIIATDDLMMPEKIEMQVNILGHSTKDVGAVYSDAYLINEDSSKRYGWFIQRYKNFKELPSGNLYNTLMEGNFLPAMALLIKKQCYDEIGFFDKNLICEDFDMWLRLSKKYKFIFSDYVSVKYRVRDAGLSNSMRNWDLELMKVYLKHAKESPTAMQMLEQLVFKNYLLKNNSILNKLSEFKNYSSNINLVYRMHRMLVPNLLGKKIFKYLYK